MHLTLHQSPRTIVHAYRVSQKQWHKTYGSEPMQDKVRLGAWVQPDRVQLPTNHLDEHNTINNIGHELCFNVQLKT